MMQDTSPAIARAPTADELEQAALVSKVAFESEEIEPWVKSHTWIADNHGLDHLVVVEAEGKLAASLLCTPGRARFGNDIVPLCAVGGVGTLPDYRKRGYAGMMMERAVRLLRDFGYHTSALWPFSYHYYRKFGWEIGADYRNYKISAELAWELASPQGSRPANKDDLPAISRLVDRFARRYNCVTVRDELWWSCIQADRRFGINGEQNTKPLLSALVHETNDQIDGYCMYAISGEGESANVDIEEIVADNASARQMLLSRLAEAGPANISFCAPVDDGFLQELPNPRRVSTEVHAGFQFRVINPIAALELRSVDPELDACIGFRIADPVLQGFEFDVEVSGGRISQAKSGARQRLHMNVQTFSQLYSGYVGPSRAFELGRIETDSEKTVEFADRLFRGGIPFRSLMEIG